MNQGMMWFGNRNYMQWVRCPEVSASYGARGSQQSSSYLNGGAFNRQTFTAAKNYRLTWSRTDSAEISKITDYVEGVYGRGNIYWTDPFTSHINALPQSIAAPSIGAFDGVILDGSDTRPAVVPTPSVNLGLPPQSALYDLAIPSNRVRPEFWVPVPPGHGIVYIVHATTSNSAAVAIRQETVSGAGSWSAITPNTKRSSANLGGTTGAYVGIRLQGTGSMLLSGVVLKVLPSSEISAAMASWDGSFSSGQGHSGVSFDGYPTKEMYSAKLDMVGLTAEFIEVGQWE